MLPSGPIFLHTGSKQQAIQNGPGIRLTASVIARLGLLKHLDGFDLPVAALWFPLVPAGARLTANGG